MNEYVLYFIDECYKTIIVYEEETKIVDYNYKKVLENVFLKKLTTLDGRIDAIKKRWGEGYNIPIIISKEICFVKVKKNVWVNIKKISYVSKTGKIYMLGGKCIIADVKYRSLIHRIDKTNSMLAEMEKDKW